MTDRRLSEDHPRDPHAALLADASCPNGIPEDPGHDPWGPIGGPYRCDCGWVEPPEEVRLLLTGSGYRRDVDEALADLPDGITVTPLQADDARLAEIRAYAGLLSAIGPDTEGGQLNYLLARVDQLTAERDQARDELTGIREWADSEQASRLEYVDRDEVRWLYVGSDTDGQPLMHLAPYAAADGSMRLRDLLDEYGPLTPVMPEETDA